MTNTSTKEIADYIRQKTEDFSEHKDMIFRDLQGDKIGSLKDMIDDINELIELREQLNKDIFADIEGIKTNINNFITQLGDTTNLAEQLNMRQKQVEIDGLRLQEKVNCWRDIAQLKRELRERIKEYKERESRVSVLDKIFEEEQ